MTLATNDLNTDMDMAHGQGDEMTSLAVLNRSEIDTQVSTAKRYPRSVARAKQRMIDMATTDQETAGGCIYTLKRRGEDGEKFITGPSIRLAEIAINAWGNIRAEARIIGEEGNFIVARGVCHDMETNALVAMEVRRRITNKYGKRYSDDMVGVTANAACAIALRNAVFKVVPKIFITPAYDAARKVIAGDSRTLLQTRQTMVEYFGKIGVSAPQLLAFLDKPGLDDVTGEDIVSLKGVATAIKDGDTTIDEQFPAIKKEPSTSKELNDKLKAAKPEPAPSGQAAPVATAPGSGKENDGATDRSAADPDPAAAADAADENQAQDAPDEAERQAIREQEVLGSDWPTAMRYIIETQPEEDREEDGKRLLAWKRLNTKGDKSPTFAQRVALLAAVRSNKLLANGSIQA